LQLELQPGPAAEAVEAAGAVGLGDVDEVEVAAAQVLEGDERVLVDQLERDFEEADLAEVEVGLGDAAGEAGLSFGAELEDELGEEGVGQLLRDGGFVI